MKRKRARSIAKKLEHERTRHLFENLPEDILKHIFFFLDKRTFLNVRAVSEKFVFSTRTLWHDLYKRTFKIVHTPTIPPPDKSLSLCGYQSQKSQVTPLWKTLFLDRSRIFNFLTRKKSGENKIKLIYKNSHTDEHYSDKGYYRIYRNDFEQAIRYFEKSIRVKKTARAYEGLARAYQQKEMHSHVIIFTEAALQYNPVNQAELLYMRGKSLHNFKRYREALNDLNGAVEFLTLCGFKHLFLKPSEVYFDRTMVNIELGNFQQAYVDCEKIMHTERFFEGGDCYMKCGKLLYEKTQYEQAERFLEGVKIKSKEYHLLFMQVLCAIGKYEKALNKYREYEATEDSPLAPPATDETYLTIGVTLFMNNFIEEAIDNFVQCIQYMATTQQHESYLGTIHKEDYEAAKKVVLTAAIRQLSEFKGYIAQITNCHDIHMAWSYYDFLLGVVLLDKNTRDLSWISKVDSSKQRSSNDEELKMAMNHFTRCITLNPTLSEPFYCRALLHCYLLLDYECYPNTGITASKSMDDVMSRRLRSSLLSKKQQHSLSSSVQSSAVPVGFDHIKLTRKILATNLMREAFNDASNAYTLLTMKFQAGFLVDDENGDDKISQQIHHAQQQQQKQRVQHAQQQVEHLQQQQQQQIEHIQQQQQRIEHIQQQLQIENVEQQLQELRLNTHEPQMNTQELQGLEDNLDQSLDDLESEYHLPVEEFVDTECHCDESVTASTLRISPPPPPLTSIDLCTFPTSPVLVPVENDELLPQQDNSSVMPMCNIMNLVLLKSYILHSLGRNKEALRECDQAIQFAREAKQHPDSNVLVKCFALRAAISKDKADYDMAHELDRGHNWLISFPMSGEDLLFVIIYALVSRTKNVQF